jgi:hypothetical protein
MKKAPMKAALLITAFFAFMGNFSLITKTEEAPPVQKQEFREITGKIKKGETLFDIFKKYKLDISELYKIREASANIHRLRELHPGRSYKIILDKNAQIDSFIYWMDDDCFLNINRTDKGYCAEKVSIHYEKKYSISGVRFRTILSLRWKRAMRICSWPFSSPTCLHGTSTLRRT